MKGSYRMIRNPFPPIYWSVPFILIMLITGCKHTPDALKTPTPDETPVSAVSTVPSQPVDAGTKAPPVDAAAADHTQVPASPNDKVSLASAETSGKEDSSETASKPAVTGKPKIDIQDPFNEAKPTLLGLDLKSSPETAAAMYGTPKEEFQMEEDTDPVTVYDYTDFLIGYNSQNQLQFIDIRSAEINPGLNGLRLGQTASDAIKALGKPDSNTSYVLTYKTSGATLKLDVDPKTEKINSIKLFAD